MDGGIRQGTDVLKALALGAKAVFVGAPMFWGLSVNGESGARNILEILRGELDLAMGLCCVTNARDIPRELVELNGWKRAESLLRRLEKLASTLEQGQLNKRK